MAKTKKVIGKAMVKKVIFKTLQLVIQQGGSTRELYAETYSSPKAAQERLQSIGKSSYKAFGPFEIPKKLAKAIQSVPGAEQDIIKLIEAVAEKVIVQEFADKDGGANIDEFEENSEHGPDADEPTIGCANEFLTHKGVTIYHAYKDREDPVNGTPMENWYSTSACACMNEFEFDVRNLPGYKEAFAKWTQSAHIAQEVIKAAIDAGLLKEDAEPDAKFKN